MSLVNLKSFRGVTIIEMLVVLAIIAILMGILVPTVATFRRKSQVRATETLIASITSALNQYFSDFDEYPPSTPDYPANGPAPTATKLMGPATVPDSLYTYLNGPTGDGFTVVATGRHYGPYLKAIPSENLLVVGTTTIVVDAWRHPLSYQNCQAHLRAGGGTNLCHNKTFDIYSIGPDGKKDPQNDDIDNDHNGRVDDAAELVDDITNW